MYDYGVKVCAAVEGKFCAFFIKPFQFTKTLNDCWTNSPKELKEEFGEYWFGRGKDSLPLKQSHFYDNAHRKLGGRTLTKAISATT